MKPLLFVLILSLSSFAASQDQAERLYDNATTFLKAGKYKEALADFQSIIGSYGESPWAARTMLELSVYYLDVENDTASARRYLEQIQQEHADSEQAPAAYYYKALISEREGFSREEFEAASADLIRMTNLFPNSPWLARARFLFGRLALRLDDYSQALSHFQRLEFKQPNSPHLTQAWLLAAKASYADGSPDRAALILARLQARAPNSPEAEQAANFLRLLDRFKGAYPTLQLDKRFFGSAPKRFSSPTLLQVDGQDQLAILAQKSVVYASLSQNEATREVSAGDIENFSTDRNGKLMLVYKNRIASADGQRAFNNLTVDGSGLRDIRAAAIDDYDRLYVVDADVRDVVAFDPRGNPLKKFGINRPRLVRAYGNSAFVLDNDAESIRRFDADLNFQDNIISGLSNIVDFCFDTYGNIYVLLDKGNQAAIYHRDGGRLAILNFKASGLPFKQAQGIAVDASGAVFLSDRRGGAVYRFQ